MLRWTVYISLGWSSFDTVLTAPPVLWYVCKLVAPTAGLSLRGSYIAPHRANQISAVSEQDELFRRCRMYFLFISICAVFEVSINTTRGQQSTYHNRPLKFASQTFELNQWWKVTKSIYLSTVWRYLNLTWEFTYYVTLYSVSTLL